MSESSGDLTRKHIKIHSEQEEAISEMDSFNLSGFVREKLDEEFGSEYDRPTDQFEPTAVHEDLDERGMLDDAHGGGVYAITIDVPDSHEAAERRWLEHFDAVPEDFALGRLAYSDNVVYVGASKDVYARLMEHARSDVRKASVLQPFPPQEVYGVFPEPNPFEAEHSHALALASSGWTCWVNGEVVG